MRLLNTLALLFMTATTALCSDAPLRHVVSFKFKKETPAQEIRKIETAFSELKWGTDVSPEGLSKGFTHMWIVTFNDLAALKTYIGHPDHVAFVNILKPNLEDVFVLDFHSKK